jgi:hypothetical protein
MPDARRPFAVYAYGPQASPLKLKLPKSRRLDSGSLSVMRRFNIDGA